MAGNGSRGTVTKDPELRATAQIERVLAPLTAAAQARVVRYIRDRYEGGVIPAASAGDAPQGKLL